MWILLMWTSADVDFTYVDLTYVDFTYVDLVDVAFDDMDPCDMEPSVICTPKLCHIICIDSQFN